FFVRHLLDVEPPDRNAETGPSRDVAVGRAAAKGEAKPAVVGRETSALDLGDLNGDRSELRGPIERYVADRGSLRRSGPPAVSPERDARLREFTGRWLDQLGSLGFDGLTRDGR